MPTTRCDCCGSTHNWLWEEAFDKFGFGDGDAQTETVADILRNAGYPTATEGWGLHNVIVVSIKDGGRELINSNEIAVGYGNPRTYLRLSHCWMSDCLNGTKHQPVLHSKAGIARASAL